MKKSDGLFLFRITVLLGVFLVTGISHTVGQVNTGGTVTTLDHNKYVMSHNGIPGSQRLRVFLLPVH
jgi:hypothetical protein